MKHIELTANYLSTIDWYKDTIVDWASAGTQYFLNGKIKQLHECHYGSFDRSISSADGVYAFIYKNRGTKGLLLKNGRILREINRSYYCAEAYEYPACFVTINNVTYLIHCPKAYNQLDFEEAETGIMATDISSRKPPDVFHSRLEVSVDGKTLLCKSWCWHPLDAVEIFDIKSCLENPLLLDVSPWQIFPYSGEMCTASFVDNGKVLIGTSDEELDDDRNDEALSRKQIAVWDLETEQFSMPCKVDAEFGNLFAINANTAWDLYKYPKIIEINTGEVLDKAEHIDSGNQRSSILNGTTYCPQIAFNRCTKSIAIAGKDKIDVLIPDQ